MYTRVCVCARTRMRDMFVTDHRIPCKYIYIYTHGLRHFLESDKLFP